MSHHIQIQYLIMFMFISSGQTSTTNTYSEQITLTTLGARAGIWGRSVKCDRYWREAECGDMSHGVHCVTALSPAWWHVTSVIITQAYILNPPILYSFVWGLWYESNVASTNQLDQFNIISTFLFSIDGQKLCINFFHLSFFINCKNRGQWQLIYKIDQTCFISLYSNCQYLLNSM